MTRVPSPGLLNFVAGVSASAAAALLVSIPLDPERIAPWRLLLAALPWGAAAVLTAMAATYVDGVLAEVNVRMGRSLTSEERVEIRGKEFGRVKLKVSGLLWASCTFVLLGITALFLLFTPVSTPRSQHVRDKSPARRVTTTDPPRLAPVAKDSTTFRRN